MLPVIRALQQEEATARLPLSVDTFHADVAVAAVEAGATMVNDVSGGTLDPRMHRQVGVTCVGGWVWLAGWVDEPAGCRRRLTAVPACLPLSRWRSWGCRTC